MIASSSVHDYRSVVPNPILFVAMLKLDLDSTARLGVWLLVIKNFENVEFKLFIY